MEKPRMEIFFEDKKIENNIIAELKKIIGEKSGIITDEELSLKIGGLAESFGLEGEAQKNIKERPFIFYRALPKEERTEDFLKKDEIVLRPFSYSLPGIKKDLPLAYGGQNPVLLRIIDLNGEWEDTGPYWGFAKNWNEAMNLNPVVLKKIDDKIFAVNDLYKEVGAEDIDVGDMEIRQITFIVDSAKTRKLRESKDWEVFADDFGFFKEMSERAEKFAVSDEEFLEKLNDKYIEYFNGVMSFDKNKVKNKEAILNLEKAQKNICLLVKKLSAKKSDEPDINAELASKTLERFDAEILKKC